jgi:RimJ/RimL family protein N-acetyltransferase
MFNELTRDDIFRIETARLWLRWPKRADAPHIARYLADDAIASMTGRIPHPYPPGEAENYVLKTREGNLDGKSLGLVITPKRRPDDVIGAVGLSPSEGEPALELGYWIGVPHWGQGYATEAVAAIIDAGFGLSDLKVLVATIKPGNIASQKVLEHSGFQSTGSSERFMPARGGTFPVEGFRLDRAAWLTLEQARRSAIPGWSVAANAT